MMAGLLMQQTRWKGRSIKPPNFGRNTRSKSNFGVAESVCDLRKWKFAWFMANHDWHPEIRWREGKKRLAEMLSGGRKTDDKDVENLAAARQISVHELGDLMTACWRIQKRALRTVEASEDSRRVLRELDAMFEIFHRIGFEIKDYTGETFDYGLPLRVITTQPVSGLDREKIVETIKPTLLWQNHLIQMGE